MKNTIVGCSHIHFLKTGDYPNWKNDPSWDYGSIVGHNSMPIFHETFIRTCLNYSGNYDNIYIFAFRSLAFNTITNWMKNGLEKRDFNHQMSHSVYMSAFNNPDQWHVNKDLLKDPNTIDIQNKFYLMWLEWYVQNIKNVRFVFWCHYGSEILRQRTYPPHLTYSDLFNKFKNNTVDLDKFFSLHEKDKIFKDGDYHPSDYGYESLRLFLNEDANKR